MNDKLYRSILGSVMWGQLAMQPNLSFSVSLLARFQANPGIEHWNALMHIIGYSGSQNRPNVLLFWIDWLGVKR